MNHLLNIVQKELKELLTPGAILSVVVVVILFGAIGTALSGESQSASAPSPIGVVYHDDGTYSDDVKEYLIAGYAAAYGLTTEQAKEYVIFLSETEDDPAGIVQQIADHGYAYVIVIPSDLSQNVASQQITQASIYYVYQNESLIGSATTSTASTIISYTSSALSIQIINQLTPEGTPAAFVQSPLTTSADYTQINGQIYKGVTPMTIAASLVSQTLMIPIIVMIVIVMVGSVVISSMGSEKENKTLETLLTLPIQRTTIVAGKLVAAALVGLFYGVAYMFGMVFYMSGVTAGVTGADLSKYGLTLDLSQWLLVMVLLFLAIFSALGICMILGAFTKNYKMAQTMTMPISFLAIIPMFVMMFASWDSLPAVFQAVMFAIPFTHPMMAMNNLMFGNYTLVFEGIIYLVVFDLVMVWLTVKVYNSDILITGLDQTKFMRKLNKVFNKKRKEDNDN